MIRRERVALAFFLKPQRVPAMIGLLAIAAAALLALRGAAAAAPRDERTSKAAKTVRYNRDIRPILADKCFKCHGPDANERKAKLRLDSARDAQKPAASGETAVVPGKLDDSELYTRITSNDPEERMPPAKTGKSLTPAEIAKLKTWIEEGAQYEGHWAFTPPVRPALPAVKQASWCRNPIDYFILARLDAEGLAPSPEADRLTLLRRLKLDLVGLTAVDRGSRHVHRRRPATVRTRGRSTDCSARPSTASAGGASGSMPPAMPTLTATKKTSRGSCTSTARG